MATANDSETYLRGEQVYREHLRDVLEPAQIGKRVVIDIASGDYELDPKIGGNAIDAERRLRERRPNGEFYLKRVGFDYVVRLRPRLRPEA